MEPCFSKLKHYNGQINTHDLLKILAVITMTIDHFGYYHWADETWLRIIGRMAAPLFFFVAGTAKHFTLSTRLFIAALLITCIDLSVKPGLHLDILINFILIKGFLNAIKPDQISTQSLSILYLLSVLFLIPLSVIIAYGSIGLLFAVSGFLISRQDSRGPSFMMLTTAAYFLKQGYTFSLFNQALDTMGLLIICLILIALFSLYKAKTWPAPRVLKNTGLFLSRYSLSIYVLQTGLGNLGFWSLL